MSRPARVRHSRLPIVGLLLCASILPVAGCGSDLADEKVAPGSDAAIKKKQDQIDRIKKERSEASQKNAPGASR